MLIFQFSLINYLLLLLRECSCWSFYCDESCLWTETEILWGYNDCQRAQSLLSNISEFCGGEFLEFILWHDMTKCAMLCHSVPISYLNSSPFNQKMILSIRFIHPMKDFVFMTVATQFQEKFHAWYQTKGNDLVYHLRRPQAWVATQSHKKVPDFAF